MEPAFLLLIWYLLTSQFPLAMSAALTQPKLPLKTWYSPEEYLDFDNAAEGRFEYMDGRITPVGQPDMVNVLDPTFRAGASPAHYRLANRLAGLLFSRLQNGCEAASSDARVHIPITRAYTYPDLVIVCGKPEYLDPEAAIPSLTNPKVIIEILSESTATTTGWASLCAIAASKLCRNTC